VDAIQVNAVLLRGLLPNLPLTVGATMVGRIMERHANGTHGLLNLAGAVLVAELPEGVPEGARLRLAVLDAGAERVVLRIVGDPSAPAAQHGTPAAPAQHAPGQGAAAAVVPLPLPGGQLAHARVEADAGWEGDQGAGTRAVTVRYASPALGRIEVRLVLSPSGLVAGVAAPPGEGAELAGAHAEELRAALRGVLGTSVEVHVGERRDRVDIRA
jgi:hypothetical protein